MIRADLVATIPQKAQRPGVRPGRWTCFDGWWLYSYRLAPPATTGEGW